MFELLLGYEAAKMRAAQTFQRSTCGRSPKIDRPGVTTAQIDHLVTVHS